MKKEQFRPARTYAGLSVGDTVRVVRELQAMTQAQLSRRSGVTQPIISGIENGRVSLGVERAKRLARALKVHPAVLLFPDWDGDLVEHQPST
jgi:transcriptional regulator with XRE-family HTH domain